MSLMALSWCFAALPAEGQKMKSKSGRASFTSDAPLEVIQASSDKVTCVLDPQTRDFAFLVPMQSFAPFNSSLQRQHFNERYVESEKFPNGTFAGKIIEEVDLTVAGSYTVRAKGKLTIHGISTERIIKATVVVSGKQVQIKAKFDVSLDDHKIAIPRIVSRKIAEVINVSFETTLKP